MNFIELQMQIPSVVTAGQFAYKTGSRRLPYQAETCNDKRLIPHQLNKGLLRHSCRGKN